MQPTELTLTEFLNAPIATVQQVAPTTMIYTPGGTRRAGVLAGLEPWSQEFVSWARAEMLRACEVIFAHGVGNLVLPALVPTNFQEVNRYRDQLSEWVTWGLSGPETMALYAAKGWRVRLLCDERIPELLPVAARLKQSTPQTGEQTLYWTVTWDATGLWSQLLQRIVQAQAVTQYEAIRACYGEAIPPATLLLSFGKPMISHGLIPPLLLGEAECYWTQQAGYSVNSELLRRIFYDYAYTRRTWQPEKLTRAKAADAHPAAWQAGPTLGLGTRLGPFWYPEPINPL